MLLLVHRVAVRAQAHVRLCTGGPGSGVGKGGGGGGAVREAGGTFGKLQAVNEDQFFYNLQREQLAKLNSFTKDQMDEIEQIKKDNQKLQESVDRLQEYVLRNPSGDDQDVNIRTPVIRNKLGKAKTTFGDMMKDYPVQFVVICLLACVGLSLGIFVGIVFAL